MIAADSAPVNTLIPGKIGGGYVVKKVYPGMSDASARTEPGSGYFLRLAGVAWRDTLGDLNSLLWD